MNARRERFYRVGGAIVLLVAGVLIVVWAARSHFLRPPPDHQPALPRAPLPSPPPDAAHPGSLTSWERGFLLKLARRTIEEVVTNRRMPVIDAGGLSSRLTERKGCFVTLKKRGELRGCIGYIFPQEALCAAVMDNARNAAIMDRRFLPVQPQELEEIEIEISVLTVPRPLDFASPEDLLGKLRPGVDGVVLEIGSSRSTFLPQVWEEIPDPETFLARLSAKAELPSSAWKMPGTRVLTYQVEAFKESEL